MNEVVSDLILEGKNNGKLIVLEILWVVSDLILEGKNNVT